MVMSMYIAIPCAVGRGCLPWPVHSFGKTLLAFALFHLVLQSQTCLLFQVSLDFLLLHSSPLCWRGHLFFFFFGVNSRSSCKSSKLQLCSSTSTSPALMFGALPWVTVIWMVHIEIEQRSFCPFWDCIQELHFGLFCWLWWLLHFF